LVGGRQEDLQRKKMEGEGMSERRRWWGCTGGIDGVVVLLVMVLVAVDAVVVYETAANVVG